MVKDFAMIPTKKGKSLQTLKKEADEVFSEYVRRSEADEHGYITCLICGTRVHWKQADNAHFHDRDHMGTRYDDLNCWPTDRHCNRYDDNHRDRYEKALRPLIGSSEFESLELRSRSMRKFFPWELEEMIVEWKAKIAKLKS